MVRLEAYELELANLGDERAHEVVVVVVGLGLFVVVVADRRGALVAGLWSSGNRVVLH